MFAVKTVRSLLSGVAVCVMMLVGQGMVFATSAQVSISEPLLPTHGKNPSVTAFFGAVAGSKLYDTAGTLGATMPLGTAGGGTFYFFGDLFTWIRNPTFSNFEPQRIVYTLEPGYNYVSGKDEYRFFIKHQSYHNIDMINDHHEGYELYGLNYRSLRNPEIGLRVGKYLNTTGVDYDWDLAGWVKFDLDGALRNKTYLQLWVHGVTEKDNDIGRNGFTDYAAELGMTINDGFSAFARYEVLHDLNRFDGVTDYHWLIGPKYVW